MEATAAILGPLSTLVGRLPNWSPGQAFADRHQFRLLVHHLQAPIAHPSQILIRPKGITNATSFPSRRRNWATAPHWPLLEGTRGTVFPSAQQATCHCPIRMPRLGLTAVRARAKVVLQPEEFTMSPARGRARTRRIARSELGRADI